MSNLTTVFQLCLVLLISLTSIIIAQEIPTIEQLESQHGSLELGDEFLVLLEVAQMEQALQEEDSLGFADGFYDEDDEGAGAQPVNTIIQFMNYFIRIMHTRIVSSDSGQVITGTFDFTIRDVNLQLHGNKIDVDAIVEFSYLTIDDSTKTPMSHAIEAKFQPKHNRWKIKEARGLFEFFNACIMRLSPGEAIPEKFLLLANQHQSSEARQNGTGGR